MRTRTRRRARAAGQAIVEFALASSLFLLTVFSLVEGGRLIYGYVVLKYAVQEGGRAAALPAETTPNEAAVLARVEERALLITTTSFYVRVTAPSGASRSFVDREAGDLVRVHAHYTYEPILAELFEGIGETTFSTEAEFVVE
jgi:Flp pilus assembly protein TadG